MNKRNTGRSGFSQEKERHTCADFKKASHAGVFRGACISPSPQKACSNENNIPFPSLANHKVAKVRFNQILEYSVHCITLVKERKEGKR